MRGGRGDRGAIRVTAIARGINIAIGRLVVHVLVWEVVLARGSEIRFAKGVDLVVGWWDYGILCSSLTDDMRPEPRDLEHLTATRYVGAPRISEASAEVIASTNQDARIYGVRSARPLRRVPLPSSMCI